MTTITISTKYDLVIKALQDSGMTTVTVDNETIDLVEFVADRKAKAIKKSTSKADEKKIAENKTIKDTILVVLENGKLRNGDIRKSVNEMLNADYSDSKISRMVTELKNDGTVVRTLDKKVAYFSLA